MVKPPTNERNALEKTWDIFQEIEELRMIYPEDEPMMRFPSVPLGFTGDEIALNQVIRQRGVIMRKLQSLQAIKILDTIESLKGGWVFSLDKEYEQVFNGCKKKYSEQRDEIYKLQNSSLLPRPHFDNQEGIIIYQDKRLKVTIGTIQFYLCQFTFERFGQKILEQEIIDASGKSDRKKTVYDAHRLLNKKARGILGIQELFEYAAARVWIRAELFEPEIITKQVE